MKSLLALVLFSSLILLNSDTASACVCNVRSVTQRKKQSQAVFIGKVIERTQQSERGATIWITKFAIERYWKGAAVSQVTVYTGPDDCAAWFEQGHKYLVFAYLERETNRLETNSCMGNVNQDDSERFEEALKKLGKSKVAVANR